MSRSVERREAVQRAARLGEVRALTVDLRAVERWLVVRAREGCPVEPGRLVVEAEHSIRGGLLGYILAGHEPHEHPPPLHYSRPWHALIDAGGLEGRIEAWRLHERWSADCGRPDAIVIAQHRWHLVETLGADDYRIEWRADGKTSRLGTWRITRTGEDERGRATWHLRPEAT